MKKFALTLIAVSALGLGACSDHDPSQSPAWKVPCGLERTACAPETATPAVDASTEYVAQVEDNTVSKISRK